MVAQTRAGGQPSPKKLSFHEKLVGKGLGTDALLKKLKALHAELAELDQELVDVASLGAARKELISTSILLHKDRGVKAYAACCLADILRLYAPDAPYTQSELRDIFQFFFRQLTSGLKGADSAYYNEYFHLLESLSTVKSVVLVCDLPSADELMVDIFRDFFTLVRRDLAKKIEMFLADILVALIDECQTLPSEVLETIMAQFMDKDVRLEQPAYRLAVQVCNATADKLQRHVCQYFTDIIVANSRDEEFDDIRAAHDLIKRLNHSCPSLLHSVIPQLEEELRVEDVQLRSIATQVLGEMFSDKGGSDLVKKYPTTWNAWLLRRNDKSSSIRLKFIEATKGLIINLTDQRDVIEASLYPKFMDPDEKVRAAVCKIYSQLDYETALHHVSESQLRAVAGRGVDKKHAVRLEALNSLGKLYSIAYPEIENNEPSAIQQFSWIPHEILHMLSVSLEVKSIVEQVLLTYILPLPANSSASSSKGNEVDESAWTDRLLNTMKYLDDKAINSLLLLTGLKNARPSLYDHYIEACIKNNGGVIDDNEEAILRRLKILTQHISSQLPDPHKAIEDLRVFADWNDARSYKLFKTCADPQTDLKNLLKASNDFLRRVEQSKPAIASTMSILLRRGSLQVLNQSSVPTLIRRVQKGHGTVSSQAHSLANNAQILLSHISKHCPALYKAHIAELTKAIADEKNPRLVEVCLQALAAVVKWDDKVYPNDKRTSERIMRHVLQSNARHAKFAARLLAFSKNKDDSCAQIVESIADGLPEASPEVLLAHITVLAQFAKYVPDAFEHRSDIITAFLLQQVLMVPTPPDPDEMDLGQEWMEDSELTPTVEAKVLALKVYRYRCLAHAASGTVVDIFTPVLKMYSTLLDYSGSFAADTAQDPKAASRLRLQAAISLLYLATVDAYAALISPIFARLAITVQDTCYNVRIIFLTKLITLLSARKLPAYFNVIPFLTVHDPEADVRTMAVSYISLAVKQAPPVLKVEQLEMIFLRLLHILAHHPDFSTSHSDLTDMYQYVQYYLDQIASSTNISLLYHLAMKLKTVRDADPQFPSENLYIMSELAQELIRIRGRLHSWSIPSYPGKVKLPPDILKALPDAQTVTKILKTVYLPEETIAWLAESTKSSTVKEKRERKPTKRKATSTAKRNGHAKRSKAATSKWRSDDDDDDDDDDDVSASESSDAGVAASPREKSESVTEEEDTGEEKLGRGARTRAKARIRRQVKKGQKGKPEVSSLDT